MNKMNILITGSNGFIGKNLKEFLSKEYVLLTPSSEELNLLDSFVVKDYFKNNKINFIIHCANISDLKVTKDSKQIVDDNLLMFDNLCENITNQRVIFFGSGAQYNKNRNLHKIKENEFGQNIPNDYYGYSKYLITKKILKMDNILNLTIFGCYGKYELQTRFPSYAINQNLKKEDIVINQNVTFDYLYICDLCKIVEYFIKNKPTEKIINITPTESIDLVSVSNIINEISNYKSKIIVRNNTLNYEYTGSNLVLLQEMGTFNFTDYKKAIMFLYKYKLKKGIIKNI